MQRRRRENHHRDPFTLRVAHRIVQLLADGLHRTQIMMRGEQALRSLAQLRGVEQVHLHCS